MSILDDSTAIRTRFAMLESELHTRDRELATFRASAQRQQESTEKIIRSLVEKNKSLEKEARDRFDFAHGEIVHMGGEKEEMLKRIRHLEDALDASRVSLSSYEVQVHDLKSLHQQLLTENERCTNRNEVLEAEIEQLQVNLERAAEDEEDIRADLENALAKLSRADSNIQLLSNEAAETSMTVLRLEHLLQEKEETLRVREELHGELRNRACRMMFELAGEAEAALFDCDELSLRTRLALHAGAEGACVDASGTVDDFAQDKPNGEVALRRMLDTVRAARCQKNGATAVSRCLPDGITTIDDLLAAPESTMLSVLTSLQEVVVLMRDDVATTLRAVEEEGVLHHASLVARFKALEIAAQAERAAARDLLADFTKLDATAAALRSEVAAHKKTFEELDSVMNGAVRMSNERSERLEALVQDKACVDEQLKEVKSLLSEAHVKIEKQTSAAVEQQSEIQALQWVLSQKQAELQHAQDATRRAADAKAEIQMELESITALNRRRERSEIESSAVLSRSELEVAQLRQQHKEAVRQVQVAQHAAALLEDENRSLRDVAAQRQKKIDALLRGGGGIPSAHLGNTPRSARSTPRSHGGLNGSLQEGYKGLPTSSVSSPVAPDAISGPAPRYLGPALAAAAPVLPGGDASSLRRPLQERCEESSADRVGEWKNRLNDLFQVAQERRAHAGY